jgi:hypothetical protein
VQVTPVAATPAWQIVAAGQQGHVVLCALAASPLKQPSSCSLPLPRPRCTIPPGPTRSCRAGSGSAWRWRGRWPATRGCCCWMSRLAPWTRSCASPCGAFGPACPVCPPASQPAYQPVCQPTCQQEHPLPLLLHVDLVFVALHDSTFPTHLSHPPHCHASNYVSLPVWWGAWCAGTACATLCGRWV